MITLQGDRVLRWLEETPEGRRELWRIVVLEPMHPRRVARRAQEAQKRAMGRARRVHPA